MTSIGNSVYLPLAFQLNEGFVKSGMLCLCGSHRLAIVAGQGPTSVSLSTILTAIVTLTAAQLAISKMPTDSTISTWFEFF